MLNNSLLPYIKKTNKGLYILVLTTLHPKFDIVVKTILNLHWVKKARISSWQSNHSSSFDKA